MAKKILTMLTIAVIITFGFSSFNMDNLLCNNNFNDVKSKKMIKNDKNLRCDDNIIIVVKNQSKGKKG